MNTASAAAQILIALIPIVGIVMGSAVVFFYLLWNHRRKTLLIRQERERLFAALASLPGVHPWPSQANFILARFAPGRVDEIFQALKARGILIKNLNGAHPLLADCLRVTVGTPEENDAFLAALKASL